MHIIFGMLPGKLWQCKEKWNFASRIPPPLTLCSVVVCSLQFYFANYDEKLFLCFLQTIYPALKLQNLSKADVIILGLAEEAASHGGTLNENKYFPWKGMVECSAHYFDLQLPSPVVPIRTWPSALTKHQHFLTALVGPLWKKLSPRVFDENT